MAGIEEAMDDIRHGRVTEYIRHLHERTPYNNLSILLINKRVCHKSVTHPFFVFFCIF